MHKGQTLPRRFDNGPVQRMQIAVMKRIQKLSWDGIEVSSVRFDSFKAVIHVEHAAGLVAQFEDPGFGVIQEGELRIVWRLPENNNGVG